MRLSPFTTLAAAACLAVPGVALANGIEPHVDRCVGAGVTVEDQHPNAEVCPPPLPLPTPTPTAAPAGGDFGTP
jgi:hypothetical protein